MANRWKEINGNEVLTSLANGKCVLIADLNTQKVYDTFNLMFGSIWNRLDDEDCKFFIKED